MTLRIDDITKLKAKVAAAQAEQERLIAELRQLQDLSQLWCGFNLLTVVFLQSLIAASGNPVTGTRLAAMAQLLVAVEEHWQLKQRLEQ